MLILAMKRGLLLLLLCYSATLTSVEAIDYRSDNYQVVVTPAKEPVFSQPVVELTNEPVGDFEATGFVQLSGWKNQGLGVTKVSLGDNSLSADFFAGGKVSAILWGDNRFGLEFRLHQKGRYQPFPIEEKLENPVNLFLENQTAKIDVRAGFEPIRRGSATNSELKYFFIPSI